MLRRDLHHGLLNRANRQHRTARATKHLIGRGAEQQNIERIPPVHPQDDEIALSVVVKLAAWGSEWVMSGDLETLVFEVVDGDVES